MNRHILIGGDSWALGEWGCTRCVGGRVDSLSCNNNCNTHYDTKYGVRHTGLEYYLKNAGYNVVNVGVAAASDTHSLSRLLTELNHNSYDTVLWFQSSPYRDLTVAPATVDELNDIIYNNIESNYKKLGEIDSKVIILGGCGRASKEILSGLDITPVIAVESIIEWLMGIPHPDIWVGVNTMAELQTLNVPIEILNYLLDNNFNSELLSEYASPDGCHLNREGHLLLFDYLVDNNYIL